jgi:hypothetical protein
VWDSAQDYANVRRGLVGWDQISNGFVIVMETTRLSKETCEKKEQKTSIRY